jgi:hypothetical protein
VVLNFSIEPAQGRVQLGWPDLAGRGWRMVDLLADRAFAAPEPNWPGRGCSWPLRPGSST